MVLKAEAVGIGSTPGTTTVAVKMLKGDVTDMKFICIIFLKRMNCQQYTFAILCAAAS